MERRRRIIYSAAQRTLIWDRWQKGETLHEIAKHFDRYHSSIQRIVAESGGIRPRQRLRGRLALSLTEREEISRALVAGRSVRSIAASLGRSPSTISREIKRNGGAAGYRANRADQAAWDRACRPKLCKLVRNRELARLVASKLRLEWAPEQIAGWLKRAYPDDEGRQVSHETIYRSLFIQTRGALKRELQAHLRRTRGTRRSRHYTQKTDIHGRIMDAVSISERPATVEDRAVPGHWEGDLYFGSKNSQIATLVERHSRYLMLTRIASKDSETVVKALIKHAKKLPQELYKSLTWDRGTEMRRHKQFTLATDIQVYLCDPQSPWQRGSNENTNGLLRQYLPKGIDLSTYSQAKLNAIAARLNERPRKTLGFETPADDFTNMLRRPVESTAGRGHSLASGGMELSTPSGHSRCRRAVVEHTSSVARCATVGWPQAIGRSSSESLHSTSTHASQGWISLANYCPQERNAWDRRCSSSTMRIRAAFFDLRRHFLGFVESL